ncbi:MAG: glycoside hydrolase family 2 protein [Candidatus Cryptobacteroides sp.]
MKKAITVIAALAAAIFSSTAQEWAPAGDRIKTQWAAEVSPANSHPEYPRPQMVRPEWKNLNGLWDYSITARNESCPDTFEGKILVPFAVESSLSGVGRTLTAEDALWYRTTFTVPSAWKNRRLMLNFEAVDWRADVFVNGVQVGTHTGGYTHFSYDVTPYLKNGANTLVVKVQDATDNDFQPHGKQTMKPAGIWYTSVSGIWQSVWMEPVANARIVDYLPVSDIHGGTIDIKVDAAGVQEGDLVKVSLLEGGIGYSTEDGTPSPEIASATGIPGGSITVPVKDAKLWSPDSPYLYGLKISLIRNGKVIDSVDGYTSMREVSVINSGMKACGLNGKALFHFGPLDQGWWPDGLYTAPTDEALKFDIEKTREFGFNMIRKHIKIEPSRWFYYCDQLGIMVWQDMPCFARRGDWGRFHYDEGTDFPASPAAKLNYYKEWGEIMDQLAKFQCIVMWVPFNEGWSQFDTREVVDFTRRKDPTRLINMASGGNWVADCGDVLDNHNYPFPAMNQWDQKMINVLGEYGGIGLPVEGHLWQTDRNWGYVQYKNSDEVFTEYANFVVMLENLIRQGVAGAVYTQTTDVEGEVNGLMTYDRKVIKMDAEKLNEVNTRVIKSMRR